MSVTEPQPGQEQEQPQGAQQDAPQQAPEDASTPAQPERVDAAPSEDLQGQIEQLRAQLEKLEERSSSGQLTLAPQDQQVADRVKDLRGQYEQWPQQGDEFAEKPQPWDLKAHELPQPGVSRDYLPGGQPDELSPVVIAHNKPILTSGMAGEPVYELAQLLANIGYPSSVSRGQNPAYAFDDSVLAAVNLFKREFHVQEDPSQFPAQHDPELYVGPWIWEALIRANDLERKAA